jgi:hypothetical protein
VKAEVYKGQLIYADTDEGQIRITEKGSGKVITINIHSSTFIPDAWGWEGLMAQDVEAVVVNGQARRVVFQVGKEP